MSRRETVNVIGGIYFKEFVYLLS